MAKKTKGDSNSERKNGKAWKQKPKENTSTGRTVGGYSIQKLEQRKLKRLNPNHKVSTEENAVDGTTE